VLSLNISAQFLQIKKYEEKTKIPRSQLGGGALQAKSGLGHNWGGGALQAKVTIGGGGGGPKGRAPPTIGGGGGGGGVVWCVCLHTTTHPPQKDGTCGIAARRRTCVRLVCVCVCVWCVVWAACDVVIHVPKWRRQAGITSATMRCRRRRCSRRVFCGSVVLSDLV